MICSECERDDGTVVMTSLGKLCETCKPIRFGNRLHQQLCSRCSHSLEDHVDGVCRVCGECDPAPAVMRPLEEEADPELVGRCFYCNIRIWKYPVGSPTDEATVDHLTPISRGGSRGAPENQVAACRGCNTSKAIKTLEEYREFVARRAAGIPNLSAEAEAWLRSVGLRIEDHRQLRRFPGELRG